MECLNGLDANLNAIISFFNRANGPFPVQNWPPSVTWLRSTASPPGGTPGVHLDGEKRPQVPPGGLDVNILFFWNNWNIFFFKWQKGAKWFFSWKLSADRYKVFNSPAGTFEPNKRMIRRKKICFQPIQFPQENKKSFLHNLLPPDQIKCQKCGHFFYLKKNVRGHRLTTIKSHRGDLSTQVHPVGLDPILETGLPSKETTSRDLMDWNPTSPPGGTCPVNHYQNIFLVFFSRE